MFKDAKLRDGLLEKLWGVGNFRAARIFFSLTFPLQDFFSVCKTFFLNYLLCMNFFSIFPCTNFFYTLPPPPPPPISFLMIRPLANQLSDVTDRDRSHLLTVYIKPTETLSCCYQIILIRKKRRGSKVN